MKVYRIPAGTYFEKQEDARKADRKFEAVEFPFAASPKADFVAWLNEQGGAADIAQDMAVIDRNSLLDDVTWKPVAQALPTQPVRPEVLFEADAIEAKWPDLPLSFRFHLCSLTMEDARNANWSGIDHPRAAQGYGGGR